MLIGFDEVSDQLLAIGNAGADVPRQLREGFDAALIHGWAASACARCGATNGDAYSYALASYFFELGRKKSAAGLPT